VNNPKVQAQMTHPVLTKHAQARVSQRGLRSIDMELLLLIGTPVDDGYLATAKNCEAVEKQCKYLLERIHRLRGKRLVMAEGRVVTAYKAERRRVKQLLRTAHERDIEDCL